MLLVCLTSRENTFWSRENHDAVTLVDRTQFFCTNIETTRWARDALHAPHMRCAWSVVDNTDFNHSLRCTAFQHFLRHRSEISLFHEDVCNAHFHIRIRNIDGLLAGSATIPDAHEHICDGVGDYHDDFLIPGTFPSFANSRKQIRQRSKSLIYPCLRPHLKQRFTARPGNLGVSCRAIVDFFAIDINRYKATFDRSFVCAPRISRQFSSQTHCDKRNEAEKEMGGSQGA